MIHVQLPNGKEAVAFIRFHRLTKKYRLFIIGNNFSLITKVKKYAN